MTYLSYLLHLPVLFTVMKLCQQFQILLMYPCVCFLFLSLFFVPFMSLFKKYFFLEASAQYSVGLAFAFLSVCSLCSCTTCTHSALFSVSCLPFWCPWCFLMLFPVRMLQQIQDWSGHIIPYNWNYPSGITCAKLPTTLSCCPSHKLISAINEIINPLVVWNFPFDSAGYYCLLQWPKQAVCWLCKVAVMLDWCLPPFQCSFSWDSCYICLIVVCFFFLWFGITNSIL